MIHLNRNKSELLVLTGAVYAFVAYLTAFSLEVLFLVDLARRSNEILTASGHQQVPSPEAAEGQPAATGGPAQPFATPFDRLTFEAMQAHLTVSCLAVAILYFVNFIASLVLIVALILRSTFILLIWTCAMTTIYLPEFGLVLYVALYGWGVETRNGQTELAFYLLRAILNVLFIYRAHRLFKQWNYEKNFFRLKTGSHHHFNGYDSPYFIGSDSLTTTINPVFSSSTLNLNRYDQVREASSSPAASNFYSPTSYDSAGGSSSSFGRRRRPADRYNHRLRPPTASIYSRDPAGDGGGKANIAYSDLDRPILSRSNFYNYLGDQIPVAGACGGRSQTRPSSMLSINDADFAEYELDLDYRTLGHRHPSRKANRARPHQDRGPRRRPCSSSRTPDDDYSGGGGGGGGGGGSGDDDKDAAGILSYSTQSLDRRQLRDYNLPEHVILKPLGHQPFDYLRRPGSTSNLSSITNLNTQPAMYSSHAKLTKRSDHDLGYRF